MSEDAEVRVYRHTAASRILASSAVAVSAVLLAALLAAGGSGVPAATWALLATMLAVGAWLSVANFGDRILLDAEGVSVRNPVWKALGLRGERRVRWVEVARVRERGRRTHFLLLRDGRPMVLDAVERYDDLRGEVVERTGLSPA